MFECDYRKPRNYSILLTSKLCVEQQLVAFAKINLGSDVVPISAVSWTLFPKVNGVLASLLMEVLVEFILLWLEVEALVLCNDN